MTDERISDERLAECPFCGGEASASGVKRWNKNSDAHWPDGTEILEAFYCNCVICGSANGGWFGFQTRNAAIEHWNRRPELLALRASHADLVKALDGLMDLFHDPSPFYIKKLGSPITNGDQDKIDDAFVAAQDVLENAKKVMR